MVTYALAVSPVGRWQPENFVAGDPALELANTISHRRDPAGVDRIAAPDDFRDWLQSLGLAAHCRAPTTEDMARVAEVREAVFQVFACRAERREEPRGAVALLLRAAAEGFEASPPPSPQAYLAWCAVKAMAWLPAHRIGACPACAWLFYDNSKSGRRRWCSMSTCGTVAKVRAFRRRQGQL
jgi:predicted RNA-binding Zn ribbon-like protein